MIINKFKKDKSNKYIVYFEDGDNIILYDDVIVKYNLLSNKKLDNRLYNEIVEYNNFLDGYYKSIKYINKKLRTKCEIKKYLLKYNIDSNSIDKIINLLYKDGYLNDERYIKAYISDRYNLSNDGPLKIKKELIKLGYNDIDNYLKIYNWIDRIEVLLNKKIKCNHSLSNNNLKSKLLSDLILLGYDKGDILVLLNNIKFNDDTDLLIREIAKVKNKLSCKYSGNELEYKVVNYLYRKGFDIDEAKKYFNEN